ncbi:hypothetical protein K3495_g6083 [Podosphaera aphanis]|nr:hypothetical protein K3495_g6083 [Podosphaera aphanis]
MNAPDIPKLEIMSEARVGITPSIRSKPLANTQPHSTALYGFFGLKSTSRRRQVRVWGEGKGREDLERVYRLDTESINRSMITLLPLPTDSHWQRYWEHLREESTHDYLYMQGGVMVRQTLPIRVLHDWSLGMVWVATDVIFKRIRGSNIRL